MEQKKYDKFIKYMCTKLADSIIRRRIKTITKEIPKKDIEKILNEKDTDETYKLSFELEFGAPVIRLLYSYFEDDILFFGVDEQ